VYSAGGTLWSSAAEGAIVGIWESTLPAPSPWIPERPTSNNGVQRDTGTDPGATSKLEPRKLAPEADVTKLLAIEARLGATLESLKDQRRELLSGREAMRPVTHHGGRDLLSGRDLAAQWLSEDERATAAREEARRQEVLRPRRSTPWVQSRDTRASAVEELKILNARERSAASELAFVQKLCHETLSRPGTEHQSGAPLASKPTTADPVLRRSSASLPALVPERATRSPYVPPAD